MKKLAALGKIARPGWGKTKIAFALELDENGKLVRVVPLSSPSPDGKKQIPRTMELPVLGEQKGNGIKSNFLWENSSYLLGINRNDKPERAKECFKAAKDLHLSLLSALDDPFARAICGFFESWEPDNAADAPALADNIDDILKGANMVFLFDEKFPNEDDALRRAWQVYYDGSEDGEKMRCLVTGEEAVPVIKHPAIKNVIGCPIAGGALLVSFNAAAFCSYEKERGYNSPVSKYAAFAYTTALNTLLADREHVCSFGDTTVVFWAEDAEPAYQTAFADFLNGGGEKITDEELRSCMEDLSQGRQTFWENVPLHPENRFFILGLAPNAARLSVRFFLRNSFGQFAKNVQKHYEDIRVVSDNRSKWEATPLWALLLETVKDDKTKNICGKDEKAAAPFGRRYGRLNSQRRTLSRHAL
jgi:CRISPR-associated protein Csd1